MPMNYSPLSHINKVSLYEAQETGKYLCHYFILAIGLPKYASRKKRHKYIVNEKGNSRSCDPTHAQNNLVLATSFLTFAMIT